MYLYRIQGQKRAYYLREKHIKPEEFVLLSQAGIKVAVQKTSNRTIEDLIVQMETQHHAQNR